MSNIIYKCIIIVWVNFYIIYVLIDINIYFIDYELLVKFDFMGVCEENFCISYYDLDDVFFVDCIYFDFFEDLLMLIESVEVDIFYMVLLLKDFYWYYIFFFYFLEDLKWIFGFVYCLEFELYSYKCYYNDSVI